ncbi:Hypothetical predicted protein [Olea europaea subsp. europaea]|uniref:Retrotransposon gag domain-containing protein n=1 Tax=Olea europaea subsp. europaea TaxID=158383 RepID=A0A8S0U1F3_OLEEU|nr:Hypothetical predicted protein [Olea europaea subsp. europaea]
MRSGRAGRRRNLPENPNAPTREDVGEASVHQTQGLPTQGNVVGNDPLFDRLATAIASILPNPDRDTSIERAIKLGAKHFVGTANPADAEEWMRNLESIFDVMGCSEEKKLRLATFLLKGVAADWWVAFRSRYHEASGITWAIFRDAFFETYYPLSYKNAKQNEFLRLTQGSMTVSEYHTKFVELSKYALVLVNEENDKCRRFEENLRPDIRAIVTGQGHARFGPLVEAALRVEAALQAGQSQGIQLAIRGNQSQTGTSSGQHKKNRGRFWPGVTQTGSFKSRSQSFGSNQESGRSQNSVNQLAHRQSSIQRAIASRPIDGLSSTRYPPCQICGKLHLGKCLKGTNGCFLC